MSWLAHAPNRKILPCTTKGPLKLVSACKLDPASNMALCGTEVKNLKMEMTGI